MARVSPKQREALEAIRDGRVTYGSLYPTRDQRAYARALRDGRLWVQMNDFLLDGTEVYGQAKATYSAMEDRGLAVVRYDLAATQTEPARTVTFDTITGHRESRDLPEREARVPGWRVPVELTDAGRAALGE